MAKTHLSLKYWAIAVLFAFPFDRFRATLTLTGVPFAFGTWISMSEATQWSTYG